MVEYFNETPLKLRKTTEPNLYRADHYANRYKLYHV